MCEVIAMDNKELVKRIMEEVKDEKLREELLRRVAKGEGNGVNMEKEKLEKMMEELKDLKYAGKVAKVGWYLMESVYDLEKDFQMILRACLETYAYAFLKHKPTKEMFFRRFIEYRHDFKKGTVDFKDFKGRRITALEIKNLVENYLKEGSHAGNSN
jgi:sialic acid synthase SpsE